jgi:hypothetical protein
MKIATFSLAAILVMSTSLRGTGKGPHASEQMHFSAEEAGVKKPVALPADVLSILRKDKMVRNVLENEGIPPEEIPLSWFSASAVHLTRSHKQDLVVVAEGPLAGGNVVTFWVFSVTNHGYELVLTAPAHDLIVKSTRWNGFRDIELTSMSAVQINSVLCRFDGKKYAGYRTKSEQIR